MRRDQSAGPEQPPGPPAPDPEPGGTGQLGEHQVRRFSWWLALAFAALTAVGTAVPAILLPNQVQEAMESEYFPGGISDEALQDLVEMDLDVEDGRTVPSASEQRALDRLERFDSARATSLGWIVALGGLGAILASVLVGQASDRTRSRRGRRAPWIIAAAAAIAVTLMSMGLASSVVLIALLWFAVVAANNAALGPLQAALADRVPSTRLGTASAIGGLGNFIGGIGGIVVVGLTYAALGDGLYALLTAVTVAALMAFVWRNPDTSSLDLETTPFSWRALGRGLMLPLRSANFRGVWVARLLLVFGFTMTTALSFFTLQSYVEPGLSAEEATRMTPLIAAASAPVTFIAVPIAGYLSDRVGRRKVFVVTASLLMAFSMLVPLVWPVLPAMFVQAMLAGLAFGIFLPVDQALFVEVLPDQQGVGRDLGLATVATALGQVLAPFAAGALVAISGGYQLIWIVACALLVVAALAILPVKAS